MANIKWLLVITSAALFGCAANIEVPSPTLPHLITPQCALIAPPLGETLAASEELSRCISEETRFTSDLQKHWERDIQFISSEIAEREVASPAPPYEQGTLESLVLRETPGFSTPTILRKNSDQQMQVVLDPIRLKLAFPNSEITALRISPDSQRIALLIGAYDSCGSDLYVLEVDTQNIHMLLHDIADMSWAADGASLLATRCIDGMPRELLSLSRTDGATQIIYTEQDSAVTLLLRSGYNSLQHLLISERIDSTEVFRVEKGETSFVLSPFVRREDQVRILITPSERGYIVIRSGEIFDSLSEYSPEGVKIEGAIPSLPPSLALLDIAAHQGSILLHTADRITAQEMLLLFNRENSTWHTYQSSADTSFALQRYLRPSNHSYTVQVQSIAHPPSFIQCSHELKGCTPLSSPHSTRGRQHEIVSARILVPTSDNTTVPVSIAYRERTDKKPRPLFISAYGAYGTLSPSHYSAFKALLIDYGFIVATAHVRGGGIRSAGWHVAGRAAHKFRGINDFIEVIQGISERYNVDRGKVVGSARSAGALVVMGAARKAPQLFSKLILEDPFIDVRGSMFQRTQPLTPREQIEWGDPTIPDVSNWMEQYTPYPRNSTLPFYPPTLISLSLADSVVPFSESLLWSIKRRREAQDQNPVYLEISPDAPHGGIQDIVRSRESEALRALFACAKIEI